MSAKLFRFNNEIEVPNLYNGLILIDQLYVEFYYYSSFLILFELYDGFYRVSLLVINRMTGIGKLIVKVVIE